MHELFDNLFIFEMANNHQGQLAHGLKIIEAMGKIARKHAIKAAVKFQFRELDTFIHPDYVNRQDVPHIPRFMSTRLTDADFQRMVDAVREQEMFTMATPFDEPSVTRCVERGIQIMKVASCSATDWPLLAAIVETGKPMVVSTGGIPLAEIDNVVTYLSHRNADFAVMHCVGIYPTDNQFCNMNFVQRLVHRYPAVPIGYSGHEAPDNLDVAKVAIAKGAKLLERHVGVPTDKIKLNAYSSNPEQTDAWVAAAKTAQVICGSSDLKSITQSELDSLQSLKRGVYAARPITQGQVITREDVFFAMPCAEGQTNSGQFGAYRATFTASRDYAPNEAIHETASHDKMSAIRQIIHDAKGMLHEARIVTGKDVRVELSHHLGIEKFRHTGALIVNVINREYCKKLVMVLPAQRHPSHRHVKKEETFQLLYGDLDVQLDDRVVKMLPGDKLLVERGVWHAFSSQHGAIFEEVSTTHYVGDSFYQDPSIDRLDPIERKTFLETW